MVDESGKSQLRLVREAATSPALLLIIFGISCVVQVSTAWIGEIALLKPVYAELELLEPVIRYTEFIALMIFVVVGTLTVVLEIVAAAAGKYHSIAMTMRAEAHERRKQKLEHEQELVRVQADLAARRRINQSLAPQPKFPMRIEPDSTTASHVVSIGKKAQRPDP
ncbi:MAG: hypothetical protein V4574_19930 [Pseudomonadota bacterium]